jgi:HSP20 family protein
MENNISHKSFYANIYPGEYTPVLHMEDLADELKMTREGTVIQPLVNVREFNNYYTAEVCIPGLNREDFIITVEDHSLFITVLHKENIETDAKPAKYKLHEFNYECFKREIILPENADTEQIHSEYRSGLLNMHIPKTSRPMDKIRMEIVVY